MFPLEINPFEKNLMQICKGSSYPLLYGEIGLMVNSLLKKDRLSEPDFRKRFLKACQKGLIAPVGIGEFTKGFRDRRYITTPHGVQAIRDVNIETGGDFSYYKNFDGTSAGLDKFLPRAAGIKVNKHKVTRAEQFQHHNANPEATKLAQ